MPFDEEEGSIEYAKTEVLRDYLYKLSILKGVSTRKLALKYGFHEEHLYNLRKGKNSMGDDGLNRLLDNIISDYEKVLEQQSNIK